MIVKQQLPIKRYDENDDQNDSKSIIDRRMIGEIENDRFTSYYSAKSTRAGPAARKQTAKRKEAKPM